MNAKRTLSQFGLFYILGITALPPGMAGGAKSFRSKENTPFTGDGKQRLSLPNSERTKPSLRASLLASISTTLGKVSCSIPRSPVPLSITLKVGG